MKTLRDKAISGIFWSFLQKVGSRGIQLIVTVILARILTPRDFGLIGMLSIFIAIGQTLMNAGFSQALIQKKNADEEDYSSVFYINLATSIAIYFVLFYTAPYIADFYKQQSLTALTRVLALIFIINAFSYVQEARMQKEMGFRTLMLIHLPSTILSGVVAIIMAVEGYGVWSIVAQQVIMRFAYAVQIWIYSKWRPLPSFNKAKARSLFSFGSKLMISGIIGTVYRNVYLVIIGKFFSPASLGFYQTANNLIEYPTDTFTSILNNVTFPVFSSIQDNDKRLKEGYKKVIQQLLFWLCPAFVLASVLAVPLFRFVFTDKWLPSVPYFQWLCIAGIFYPLNIYNLTILNVKGRSDIFLKLEILKRGITTVGIIVAIPWGIEALIIFQSANSIFCYILNGYYSGHFINYPVWEQLKDVLPIFLLSAMVGCVVLLLNQSINSLPDITRILLGIVSGIGLYGSIAYFLKFPPWLDFKQVVQTRVLTRLGTRF